MEVAMWIAAYIAGAAASAYTFGRAGVDLSEDLEAPLVVAFWPLGWPIYGVAVLAMSLARGGKRTHDKVESLRASERAELERYREAARRELESSLADSQCSHLFVGSQCCHCGRSRSSLGMKGSG